MGNVPLGMKEYQLEEMSTNFEYAFRLDVMNRLASKGEYDKFNAINGFYSTAVTSIGWTPDARPNERAAYKKVQLADGTVKWEYISPMGLTEAEYSELGAYADAVALAARKARTYIGQDDSKYLEYVRKETEAKEAFNEAYLRVIKK